MLKLEEVKMLKLEEVIGNQLEADGRVLAEKVAEYVFTCFQSRDPIVSLDPVVHQSDIQRVIMHSMVSINSCNVNAQATRQ
jgi:hypothetical protein